MRGYVRTSAHGGHHELYSPAHNAMCKRWDTPQKKPAGWWREHQSPYAPEIGCPHREEARTTYWIGTLQESTRERGYAIGGVVWRFSARFWRLDAFLHSLQVRLGRLKSDCPVVPHTCLCGHSLPSTYLVGSKSGHASEGGLTSGGSCFGAVPGALCKVLPLYSSV